MILISRKQWPDFFSPTKHKKMESTTDELLEQGIRLGQIIDKLGLTQKEFAAELDVTQPNISQVINGKSGMSMSFAGRLKRKFRVNLDWLSTGEGEMFLPGN